MTCVPAIADRPRPAIVERLVTPWRLLQGLVLARRSWRPWIALGAGAASSLSQAPLNCWLVLWLTFPILVWLLDDVQTRGLRGPWVCAWTGWCFGFGYFAAGLYWMGHAFLVDAETFAWLLPIAVTALPACLAVFTGIGCAFAHLLWVRGPARILAFAAALTAAEWLRGHVLTGLPWNTYGYALGWPLLLGQAASIIGIWGLTFVAVAVFAAPATITDEGPAARKFLPLGCAALVLIGLALFGWMRLSLTPTQIVDGVQLRIMQPNLQQDAKFNYSAKAEVMSRYLALSRRHTKEGHGLDQITHLIWPESAFPFYLNTEPEAFAQLASLLPARTVLITGADRTGPPPATAASTDTRTSIYVIDHRGAVLDLYDKVHLVPFGEFLPFQTLLERIGLSQLTKVTGGLIAGERREPLITPRAPPALPLLCYEVIFPDELGIGKERPGWLLNLTNDGWFGISSGPYQHYMQARMRAIEQGLPLVRAANTGISAVLDPLGRLREMLPLGAEGLLDVPLPRSIAPTIYARFGNWPALLLIALSLIPVIRRRVWEARQAS